MFYNHAILEVNNEPVLYLYLNSTYEFAQDFYGENRKKTLYEKVNNYIRNSGIDFKGRRVYLVVNGIIVSSLVIDPIKYDGKQKVDEMIPFYQYVEILSDLIPNNQEIELLDTDEEQEINAGKFISLKRSNGVLQRFFLEDYAYGVICSEMPLKFEKEALKAEAVLARTYALNQEKKGETIKEQNKIQAFTDKDNLKSLYKDQFVTYMQKVKDAIKETQGEYLTYHNEPIEVYTHVVNHGKTEDAREFLFRDVPYLRSVESPWDLEDFPYTNSTTFSFDEISRFLNQPIHKNTKISVVSHTIGGRIKQLRIGKFRYRVDYLYHLLGLKSTDFTVRITEEGVTFTFLALEAGLGLSKYGANGMAKQGYDYQKILSHYFPGTKIEKISS